MKKQAILSGLLALSLMGALPVMAAPAPQTPDKEIQAKAGPADAPAVMPAPKKERKMSPEQREKLQAAFAKHADTIASLEDQLFVKHQELRALQNANQPDVAAVSAAAKEVVKLRRELDAQHREIAKEAGLPERAHFMGGPRGPHHGKAGRGPAGCPGMGGCY